MNNQRIEPKKSLAKVWGKIVLVVLGLDYLLQLSSDVGRQSFISGSEPAFIIGKVVGGPVITALVIGSIIFGIWYVISGRKK